MSSILLALLPMLASGEDSVRAADGRGLPARLADTGLYAPDGSLSRDVVPFSPQYPLWSDGAAKRRWIRLPAGTSIDASRPDAWDFPRGTKLWKEFSHGRALETRYLERGADGAWKFGSYVWSADGREATLAPAAGLRDLPVATAPGAHYSIPSENDCRACHEGGAVPVLGFSALQLSSDRDPLAPHADTAATADLRSLSTRGLLTGLPAALLAKAPRIAAANPAERAALGYLHGNCGNCHNDDGPLSVLEMNLAQRVSPDAPSAVLPSIVGVESSFRPRGVPAGAPRIAPGHEATSVIALRMASRDPVQQMPPLGSAAIDAEALALIARWIDSLPSNNP
ncbi:MAG TPA: hypothetical protein VMF52_04575 [Steroidobacteraceae bacterium]|nr:hypothetical protein [Steroidobacteraceae bacterium]